MFIYFVYSSSHLHTSKVNTAPAQRARPPEAVTEKVYALSFVIINLFPSPYFTKLAVNKFWKHCPL